MHLTGPPAKTARAWLFPPVMVALLALPLLTASCAWPPTKKPMISQPQALEIANAEFTKAGHQPSEYDVSVTTGESEGWPWMVWFERKGPFPLPGGRHVVEVNRNTGEALFMPGE